VFFRGVIFDLDGTLLNTLDDLADAMNIVLERNRLPVHATSAYRYFVGDGIDMLVRRALPVETVDDAEIRRIADEMRREYAQHRTCKTKPYPGIPAMLEAFAAARFAMAVLSNKPDEDTRQIIAALLPRVPFGLVIGATAEKPKKPDPAVALEMAERLLIPPDQFIFMGDTSIDMRTASAAGMFPLGVLWGFRAAEELIAAGAKLLVREPADVIRWICPVDTERSRS
jgi:phosphoglycolate phosphatase